MSGKSWAARKAAKQRKMMEIEDELDVLNAKCAKLAEWIKSARCTVVYTGAGISTSASIPDYRGPTGIWTLAEQGKTQELMSRCVDPIGAEPTSSHMALVELHRNGYVRHVVSQNCDGLHLRPYDVTRLTGFRRHATGRRCDKCHANLMDTIVHFGEVGRLEWPLNWHGIEKILSEDCCDLILVLGSSLKVMGKYKFLWPDSKQRKKVKIVIVNLQWTSKDQISDLKIHGKCDDVMRRVTDLLNLNIPRYCRSCDRVLDNRRRITHNARIMSQLALCQCRNNSKGTLKRKNGSTNVDLNGTDKDNNNCVKLSNGIQMDTSNSNSNVIPGWWAAGFQAQVKKVKLLKQRSTMAAKRARESISSDLPYVEETREKSTRKKRPVREKIAKAKVKAKEKVKAKVKTRKVSKVGHKSQSCRRVKRVDDQISQCVQDILDQVCGLRN